MGNIKDGEIKLNQVQVADKLRNEITEPQAKPIAKALAATKDNNEKRRFAHAVLDAYKEMPSTTDHDMEVKKLTKHLMEKYMKSTAVVDGEGSVFRLLINDILVKGGMQAE